MRNFKVGAVAVLVAAGMALTGCTTDSTRQIDPIRTGSFEIPGTSWKGFCQGNNAFIYVPSRRDSEPDELEAVVYDYPQCVASNKDNTSATPSPSTKPDSDPDGIVDDED